MTQPKNRQLVTYPSKQQAIERAQQALADYTRQSKWNWTGQRARYRCVPHPKLPCILFTAPHKTDTGWLPAWALFAGEDLPDRRFFQWASVGSDLSNHVPLDEAGPLVDHLISDYVFAASFNGPDSA